VAALAVAGNLRASAEAQVGAGQPGSSEIRNPIGKRA